MSYMDSDLYATVINDNIDDLQEIEQRLSVGDQVTPTKSSVLHLACQYGSTKCVEHILNVHETLLFKINSRGETALHLAAKQGNSQVVIALIRAAKTLDQHNNNLQNAIPSMVVKDLIRSPDRELETALHGAVRYNRKDVVKLLVENDPTHVHSQNKHKESPLYLASIRNYADLISIILENCEWPDIGDADGRRVLQAMFGGPDGRTALHAAVLDDGGHECVKVLLEKNKSLIKVVDNYGWTAYHYVAYNDLYTIVEALVDADKYVAYLQDNEYKRTALHVAAYKGNLLVMKKLVEYFPDSWEIEDGSGRNILHIAVEENRKEVIDFILSRGFEASNNLLTKRDSNGNTPLHLIAKLGCFVRDLMDGKTKKQLFLEQIATSFAFKLFFIRIRVRTRTVERPQWKVDWEVLDSKNYTPLDVLHSEQDTHTIADQLMVRTSLIEAKVKKHWCLWRTLKEPDVESGKRIVKHSQKTNNQKVEELRKAVNTHIVVSALIATIAFTALFNIPGGYDGNKGSAQGSPVLLRHKAFSMCIFYDAWALLFSMSSLLIYFLTSLKNDARLLQGIVYVTACINYIAVVLMMLAFITGTYAVLADYSRLAISVCTVTSIFFIIAYIFLHVFLAGQKHYITLLPRSSV